MEQNSLSKFIEEIRPIWGPLTSDLVNKSQRLLEGLANAPSTENWLTKIQISEKSHELYRDPDHGFVLLAHIEQEGLYRAPHDHGKGWVVYAVQSGEMEMGTYGLVQNENGELKLIRRERYRITKGQSRLYLPGDIHDTKCVAGPVLMLRLTSCDLKIEKLEGRMREYGESGTD